VPAMGRGIKRSRVFLARTDSRIAFSMTWGINALLLGLNSELI